MQFRDLGAQYKALKSEIDAGIEAVIDSNAFILGKPVAELEEKLAQYVGRTHFFHIFFERTFYIFCISRNDIYFRSYADSGRY